MYAAALLGEDAMKAVAVTPRKPNTLRIVDQDVPALNADEILLDVQKVGVCGTDRDIIAGFYGEAPQGLDYLVIGHESLSRIAGTGNEVKGFRKGDLVVPTVRRSCPENCLNCSIGESDMCLTGHYKEHGIKGLHGFAREFAVSDSKFVVKLPESLSDVGILLEPLTIVEKGLTQAYEIQQSRMKWKPKNALVLGAGPVGLLVTALLRLKGLDVHTVATRGTESLKARLVGQTGASYVNAIETPLKTLENRFDLVFEITGNASVALEAQRLLGVNGIVSFLGVYKDKQLTEDAGKIFTDLVLGNGVYFGSVNANKAYFVQGVKDLKRIMKKWKGFLENMITRRGTIENLDQAYGADNEEEIKTIIEFK
jgi:threonine dehydrogenase-like Zn-dependent dehydrogenase